MQIDFHHGVTYVLARFAGFAPPEARVIAYASQYVDDAVTTGAVRFDNGAMYARISSAHKMLDYRNFEALASHADTWAHQGFAGVSHAVNHARDVTGPGGAPDEGLMDRLKNFFINEALPLGDASDPMCRAMQCFRAGDPAFPAPGIAPKDRETLARLLMDIRADDSDDRHKVWLEQIAKGAFSFGPEEVTYIEQGEGSWKHAALGAPLGESENEGTGGTYAFRPEFLRSDWKLFHDALQAHRFDVIHNILPEYGICAA